MLSRPVKKSPVALTALVLALCCASISSCGRQTGGANKPEFDLRTLNEMSGSWTDPNGARENRVVFHWEKSSLKPAGPENLSGFKSSGRIENLHGYTKAAFTYEFYTLAPFVTVEMKIDGKDIQAILKARDHDHMSMKIINRGVHIHTQEALLGEAPDQPTVNLVRVAEGDSSPHFKEKGSPWGALSNPFSQSGN